MFSGAVRRKERAPHSTIHHLPSTAPSPEHEALHGLRNHRRAQGVAADFFEELAQNVRRLHQHDGGAVLAVGPCRVLKQVVEIGEYLLDIVLREETGIPVFRCEDPLLAVVNGVGRVLDDLERYHGLLF